MKALKASVRHFLASNPDAGCRKADGTVDYDMATVKFMVQMSRFKNATKEQRTERALISTSSKKKKE